VAKSGSDNMSSDLSTSDKPIDLSLSASSADFEKVSLPSTDEEDQLHSPPLIPSNLPTPVLPPTKRLPPHLPRDDSGVSPSTGDPVPKVSSAANFLHSLGATTEPMDFDTTHRDLEKSLRILSTIFPRWIQKFFITEKSRESFLGFRRRVIRAIAAFLYHQKMLPSNVVYDIFCVCWKFWILNLFFREIRPRGAHNIPKLPSLDTNLLASSRKLLRRLSSTTTPADLIPDAPKQDPNSEYPVVQPHDQKYKTIDPLIFVAGPHNNQFLDGLILMITVLQNSGRRVSLLIAEKSMQGFIGWLGKCMHGSKSDNHPPSARH
jgi:hypothetical protein